MKLIACNKYDDMMKYIWQYTDAVIYTKLYSKRCQYVKSEQFNVVRKMTGQRIFCSRK